MSKPQFKHYFESMSEIPSLYNSLPPIPVLHPELKDELRMRMETNIVLLITKNMKTTFFRESDVLADLRRSVSAPGKGHNGDDAGQLLKQFTAHVRLSDYDAYRPFINRFIAGSNNPNSSSPCSIGAVRDLLSPGLPAFLAQSSATSGSESKIFPQYLGPIQRNEDGVHLGDDSPTICGIYGLRTCGEVSLADTDGRRGVKGIPITIATSGYMRMLHGITLENEEERARMKLPSNVAPVAVGLLPSHRAMCFTYIFFAVGDEKLGYIAAPFTTHLSDCLDSLVEHWDLVVDSIEKGIPPKVFELGTYESCLQAHIKPNPARAQELRSIAVGQQGWLKKVWPHLKFLRACASGTHFSAPIPNLRHQFGPDVALITGVLGASECVMGRAYSASDLNLYKLNTLEFFEFLHVEEPETSEHLLPCWEVVVGKQYEIVATTQGGLWRYRMGDIIEIAGFAPEDGLPLMRFIERRGVKIRVYTEVITETQLGAAIHSNLVANVLGQIAEFTTVLDVRKPTKAYGFFVELRRNSEKSTGPSSSASSALQAYFSTTNARYQKFTDEGLIGKPTIRIVAPGTFQAYREWKVNRRGIPTGQVKVPVAISPEDVGSRDFFEGRVLSEV